ncbi:MAG: DHH family phosphoesterase [Lachnospiraceae bacterium]|nr:DHH family phosphoesterase [Lachnospiraceae bacterium]
MRTELAARFSKAKRIALIGHVRPDGDAIGACLGLKRYLEDNYPGITADVWLEPFAGKFSFLCGAGAVRHDTGAEEHYDLAVCLDCSEPERMGEAARYFHEADHTVCIDHHMTNVGFGEVCLVDRDASSTCEFLCGLLDMELIGTACAECFYTGIVHDTGVFKHTNTTRKTMETAGMLIEKGVVPEHIINDSFYKKTFVQNKMLGLALDAAELHMEGRLIAAVLTGEDAARHGAAAKALDGIIDQLHVTDGVEVSVLLYELEPGLWKASMRAHGEADVARVAMGFGGGGHVKAAGFESRLPAQEILRKIIEALEG